MSNVQPALCGGNGSTTDLHIVLSESSDSILVFLGVAVLERIRCSRENLQYKMLLGRLVNAGWALSRLQETFGHDPRTLKSWAAALLSDDPELMVQAFSGRGFAAKITPAIARYVKQRYEELRGTVRNYRQVIGPEVEDLFAKRLSGESLRLLFRAADRERVEQRENTKRVLRPAAGMDNGCASAPDSSTDSAPTRNQSPDSTAGVIPIREPVRTSRAVAVHHAGMILFAALLDVFCHRRPRAVGRQTQWIGQVLQGAVNIEQSRLITGGDLARFTGPVDPGTDPQRTELSNLAGLETVLDIYAANARLIPDGPGRGRVFYYDPHSKEYTGGLNVLKDWCGRRHGVAKVIHLDMIHSRSGRPCFVQHYSPYYDLRERFFMTLTLFNELFPGPQRCGRVFVLDRGIYGLDTFNHFAEVGDYVLTWEKGYRQDGWDGRCADVVFCRCRPRNHARDILRYRFECREAPWQRDPRIRRILVRGTNPKGRTILVSVLCSDPNLPVEDAVWLMFDRWVQENDFRYLDRHFGLNQLTSYASKTVAEDAGRLRDKPVDSLEYKELKKQEREAETRLARELLIRENARDKITEAADRITTLEAEQSRLVRRMETGLDELRHAEGPDAWRALATTKSLPEQARELRKQLRQLRCKRDRWCGKQEQIQERTTAMKDELGRLRGQLAEAVRLQSRLRLLIDNHYRLLDTRCKATLDALRIAAANMFAALLNVFRPIYGNYRNDHVMLRNLTRADGFLSCDDGVQHVRLWLKGRFQKWQLNAFAALCGEISARINDNLADGHMPVRISVLDESPRW